MTSLSGAQPRVLHVSPTYFGDQSVIGGGERYALDLARTMARRTSTRFVACGHKDAAFRCGALRGHVLRSRPVKGGGPISQVSLAILPHLWDTDIIHCHQFYTPLTDLVLLVAKVLRKKVFVTPHGGGTGCLSSHIGLSRLVTSFLHVCAYSQTSYPVGAYQSQVIYGGVDTQWFSPADSGGINRGVLFVGRLIPFKGVDYLVRAVPPHVPVRLVGRAYDPLYLEELRQLAHGKDISFVTNASQRELRHYYRTCQFVVLPSRPGELFPLTILEAMACGRPVVCTDVGGTGEAVSDGETGFLIPPHDVDALAERMNWLLAHPREGEAMGRQGRARVLDQFTWEKVADRCLAAYAQGNSRSPTGGQRNPARTGLAVMTPGVGAQAAVAQWH